MGFLILIISPDEPADPPPRTERPGNYVEGQSGTAGIRSRPATTDKWAWTKGGTLHDATIAEWRDATRGNKLATSADWIAKALPAEGRSIDFLNEYAPKLVQCTDAMVADMPQKEQVKVVSAACFIRQETVRIQERKAATTKPATIRPATSTESTSSWTTGGTLHDATIADWKRATYSNKLATSADWIAAVSAMKDKIKNMTEFRSYADELLECIDILVADPDTESLFSPAERTIR